MINVTVTSDSIQFQSSVSGAVSAVLVPVDAIGWNGAYELVDEKTLHVSTDQGVFLLNVVQYIFNDSTYLDAQSLVEDLIQL
jgi:hypothetical protein